MAFMLNKCRPIISNSMDLGCRQFSCKIQQNIKQAQHNSLKEILEYCVRYYDYRMILERIDELSRKYVCHRTNAYLQKVTIYSFCYRLNNGAKFLNGKICTLVYLGHDFARDVTDVRK